VSEAFEQLTLAMPVVHACMRVLISKQVAFDDTALSIVCQYAALLSPQVVYDLHVYAYARMHVCIVHM
jgi:hypothetical protein